MPGGAPGCDASLDNPFARAVTQLFEEGRPFPNLCKCFFKDPSGVLRWFGVFVHSAGNRVLFFPGFVDNFDKIFGFCGNDMRWNESFRFDHSSLESDRSRWHATSPRSGAHLGSPSTFSLGQDRVLWFGLSLSAPSVLRVVHEETQFTCNSPPGDSKRRMEVFYNARKDAKFPIIMLNDEHPAPADPCFLHFGLIVGPKGFEDYSGTELGFPYGSPFLDDPLPSELNGLPIRLHRIELSESVDIQITSCILPGKLNTPVTLTSPSRGTAGAKSIVAARVGRNA
jgi:hypothetical protein